MSDRDESVRSEPHKSAWSLLEYEQAADAAAAVDAGQDAERAVDVDVFDYTSGGDDYYGDYVEEQYEQLPIGMPRSPQATAATAATSADADVDADTTPGGVDFFSTLNRILMDGTLEQTNQFYSSGLDVQPAADAEKGTSQPAADSSDANQTRGRMSEGVVELIAACKQEVSEWKLKYEEQRDIIDKLTSEKYNLRAEVFRLQRSCGDAAGHTPGSPSLSPAGSPQAPRKQLVSKTTASPNTTDASSSLAEEVQRLQQALNDKVTLAVMAEERWAEMKHNMERELQSTHNQLLRFESERDHLRASLRAATASRGGDGAASSQDGQNTAVAELTVALAGERKVSHTLREQLGSLLSAPLDASREIQYLRTAVCDLKEKLSEADAALTHYKSMEEEYERGSQLYTAMQSENSQLLDMLEAKKTELAGLQSHTQMLQEFISKESKKQKISVNSQPAASTVTKTSSSSHSELTTMRTVICDLQRALESEKRQGDSTRIRLERELDVLQQRARDEQRELADLRDRFRASQEAEFDLLASQTELRGTLAIKLEELRIIRFDRDNLHLQVLDLRNRIDDIKPTRSHAQASEKLTSALERQCSEMTAQYQQALDRIKVLQAHAAERNTLHTTVRGLQEELSQSKRTVADMEARLATMSKALELAQQQVSKVRSELQQQYQKNDEQQRQQQQRQQSGAAQPTTGQTKPQNGHAAVQSKAVSDDKQSSAQANSDSSVKTQPDAESSSAPPPAPETYEVRVDRINSLRELIRQCQKEIQERQQRELALLNMIKDKDTSYALLRAEVLAVKAERDQLLSRASELLHDRAIITHASPSVRSERLATAPSPLRLDGGASAAAGHKQEQLPVVAEHGSTPVKTKQQTRFETPPAKQQPQQHLQQHHNGQDLHEQHASEQQQQESTAVQWTQGEIDEVLSLLRDENNILKERLMTLHTEHRDLSNALEESRELSAALREECLALREQERRREKANDMNRQQKPMGEAEEDTQAALKEYRSALAAAQNSAALMQQTTSKLQSELTVLRADRQLLKKELDERLPVVEAERERLKEESELRKAQDSAGLHQERQRDVHMQHHVGKLEQLVASLRQQLRGKQADNFRLWRQLTDLQAQRDKDSQLVKQSQEHLRHIERERLREASQQAIRVSVLSRREQELSSELSTKIQMLDELKEVQQSLQEQFAEQEEALGMLDTVQREFEELQEQEDRQRHDMFAQLSKADELLASPSLKQNAKRPARRRQLSSMT